MNPVKFYRLDTWYKNMGMALIGVFSAGVSLDNAFAAAIGFLQVFLVQLHSFSMNDYYDHLRWGEETYVGKLLSEGWDLWQLRFLMLAPLALALMFYPVSQEFTLLLVLYSLLFYLYQGPMRLKRHWAFSIPLNAIPLGLIIYLHPYLVTAGSLGATGLFFSILFTFYLAFYEIAHQIEHQEEEREVFSLIDQIGVKNSLIVATLFLIVPVVTGIFLAWSTGVWQLYLIPAFFFIIRVLQLHRIEDYGRIRKSRHKFYAAHEGIYYLIILSLISAGML